MNKKFFTLIASALVLAASVGTVSAQIPEYESVGLDFAKYATDHEDSDDSPFQNAGGFAKLITKDTYFHLGVPGEGDFADAEGVLAMRQNPGTGQFYLQVVNRGDVPYKELRFTLWTIDYSGDVIHGYHYTYTNLGTGMQLSFDSKDALAVTNPSTGGPKIPVLNKVALGGEAYNWKWGGALSTAPIAPDKVGGFFAEDAVELTYSYGRSPGDSVMVLYKTGVEFPYDVTVLKYAANRVPALPNVLELVPTVPNPVLLSADDLNSMLWNDGYLDGVRFSFNKDVEGGDPAAVNLWSSKKYVAVPAVSYPTAAYQWDDPANFGPEYDDAAALESAQHYLEFGQDVLKFLGSNDATVDANLRYVHNAWIRFGPIWDAADTENYEDVLEFFNTIDITAAAGESQSINNAFYNALVKLLKSEKDNFEGLVEFMTPVFAFLNGLVQDPAGPPYYPDLDEPYKLAKARVTSLESDVEDLKEAAADEKETNEDFISTQKWLSLYDAEAKGYLMLDTAYLTDNLHLKFNTKKWSDLTKNSHGAYLNSANLTRLDINGRFNYQFVWYPHADSLSVRVAGYAKLENSETNVKYFKDMELVAGSEYTLPSETDFEANMQNPNTEMNLVKIAVLTNNHREVTVGSTDYTRRNALTWSINTRISIDAASGLVKTTLKPGVYFFKLATQTGWKLKDNGKYRVVDYPGMYSEYTTEEIYQYISDAPVQDFGHMPRTQWVVEQNDGIDGQQTVNIYNREFPNRAAAKNVQLYADADNKDNIFAQFITLAQNARIYPLISRDTFSYELVNVVKPKSGVLTDKRLGYGYIDTEKIDEKIFKLDYLSGLKLENFVDVKPNELDTTLYVDGDKEKGVYVQFVEVSQFNSNLTRENKYGYAGKVAPQLYRTPYLIRVFDSSKLSNDRKYVVRDWNNDNTYAVTAFTDEELEFYLKNPTINENPAIFFLKENNQLIENDKSTCYYALQEAYPVLITNTTNKYEFSASRWDYYDDCYRVGVRDASLRLTIEDPYEKRIAAFALRENPAPLYRRLGVTNPDDGFKDMDVAEGAKIYRKNNSPAKEYLYEVLSNTTQNGVYYKEGISFLGVEGKGFETKPTLYVDTAYVRDQTSMPQYMFAVRMQIREPGMWCPDEEAHNAPGYGDCGHKVPTEGYKVGDYLINYTDSVKGAASKDIKGENYLWNNNYVRLGFVTAKHIGDTLIIYRDGKPSTEAVDSIFLGDNLHNKRTDAGKMHKAHKNGIKNPVFALRLVDDKIDADFLIESEGDHKIPTADQAGWVKIQNGVPVIAHYARGYNEAILDAEIFNIETSDEIATSNEEAAEEAGVKVVAGYGEVTVYGAAGKTVSVSNILGQVVASKALTSNQETVSLPKGIAIVAVEGGKAIKAVVK